MKLTSRQRDILIGVLQERDSVAAKPFRFERSQSAVTERLNIQDARDGLVQCHPALWLGMEMTSSLSTMVSRTYEQLEKRGLIVRHRLGYDEARTSHLSLTPAGEALAKGLLATEGGSVEPSGFCVTGAPHAEGAEQQAREVPSAVSEVTGSTLPKGSAPPMAGAEQADQGGPSAYLPNRAWSAAHPAAGYSEVVQEGPAGVSEGGADG